MTTEGRTPPDVQDGSAGGVLALATAGIAGSPALLDAVTELLLAEPPGLEQRVCLEAAQCGPGPGGELRFQAAAAVALVRVGGQVHDRMAREAREEKDGDRGSGPGGSRSRRRGAGSSVIATALLLNRGLALCAELGGPSLDEYVAVSRQVAEARMEDVEDIFDITRTSERYMTIVDRKEGSLVALGAALGGRSAGADEETVAALREFGRELGMAGQIAADVRDLVAAAESPAHHSVQMQTGVYTLPVIHAIGSDPAIADSLPAMSSDPEEATAFARFAIESGAVRSALAEADRHAGRARAALDAVPGAAGALHLLEELELQSPAVAA
jgi:geranylgeranyl pyrophosphate synthase